IIGDNSSSCCYFISNKLRSNPGRRCSSSETVSCVLMIHPRGGLLKLFDPLVFANSYVLHFGSYNSFSGIMQLSYVTPFYCNLGLMQTIEAQCIQFVVGQSFLTITRSNAR